MTGQQEAAAASASASLMADARRHDPDRVLGLIFAPPSVRDILAGLILLNHELARIPELVREPMAGMIRYQWWRDGIETAARAETVGHPALDALQPALADGRLDVAGLIALVDAREHDLEAVPPEDLQALEAYAAATSGRLHQLMLSVLGCAEPAWLHAALDVGIAVGLVGLVRAVAFHARQSRVFLPEGLMIEAGVTRGEVLEARNAERLRQVTGRIVERGEALLRGVRQRGRPPRRWLPALLAARPAAAYARRLRRSGFDPFVAAATERPPTVAWDLVLNGVVGRL